MGKLLRAMESPNEAPGIVLFFSFLKNVSVLLQVKMVLQKCAHARF